MSVTINGDTGIDKITDGSVVQADLASGVASTGPAFSAYANATTSMSSGTWTKIAFQVELWDTNSNYDNATNYRFTPTVEGYYQVNGCFNMATTGLQLLSIYRNGSEYKRGTQLYNPGGTNTQSPVSALVYLNGSTDYIELYGYQSSGGALNLAQGAPETWFDAALVRAA